MKVLFVAGVAPIVPDLAAARSLYVDGLGLPLSDDDYPATFALEGVKHFGLWPLAEAAVACFGRREWPSDVPVPQASIEFEVEDVAAAAAELESRGHRLLHGPRTEPWGQTVARLLGPEGLLVGLSYAPWFHEEAGAAHGDS
jgi:catechol 2,3-dioxygenase-like lactoylglutathione lyase family enzyme